VQFKEVCKLGFVPNIQFGGASKKQLELFSPELAGGADGVC